MLAPHQPEKAVITHERRPPRRTAVTLSFENVTPIGHCPNQRAVRHSAPAANIRLLGIAAEADRREIYPPEMPSLRL